MAIVDLDIGLKPEGGLIRRIRSGDATTYRCIPVIGATPSPTPDLIDAFINTGGDYLLQKPVSIAMVWRKVNLAVTARREFIRIDGYFGPDRRRSKRDHEGKERRMRSEFEAIETPSVESRLVQRRRAKHG